MRRLLVAAVLVAGCHSSSSTGSSSSELTYWKSVKPIADAKCVGCHTENNIAPFTLKSFADFKAHTDMVRVAVAARVMPPWPPNDGCSQYQNDRSLSDAEVKTITDWIDQGAVEGDPSEYQAPTVTASGLSRVDRTLQLPLAYQPTLKPDEYRCFIMDWPDAADTFVTGFRANPGNAAIVHHVIAFLAPPDKVAEYQQLDDADPNPGYVCFGGPGGSNQDAAWLGGWAPGSLGQDFPAGTGIKVQAGSKIILQVHYNLVNDNGVPDQTSVDFKVDPTVTKQAVLQPWADPSWVTQKTMTIPAGAGDQKIEWTFSPSAYWSYITNGVVPSSVPVTMYAASLHMHTRGRRATLEIVHGDGTKECMLDIPRWDFHWQGSYAFQQPKTFAPGDSLHLECHFDNTDSSIDRNWGEGTDDEMCLGGFYVTP